MSHNTGRDVRIDFKLSRSESSVRASKLDLMWQWTRGATGSTPRPKPGRCGFDPRRDLTVGKDRHYGSVAQRVEQHRVCRRRTRFESVRVLHVDGSFRRQGSLTGERAAAVDMNAWL